MPNLVIISMNNLKISEFPEQLLSMPYIQRLSLKYCKELKKLPEQINQIKYLRQLELGGSGIEVLPDSFGELEYLE